MIRKLFISVALLVAVSIQAAEYKPSTVPDPKQQGQEFYVANPDQILPDSIVRWLNDCSQSLYNRTKVEMAVVALGSIGDYDAFDFCLELFQRWGIGGKDRNTGVLILFVYDSHDIRIMTGTGIEGVLTDARCSQIVHDDMIPAFKAGAYGDGLCLGAMRIYEICTEGEVPEELLTIRSVTDRGRYASGGSSEDEGGMDGWTIFGIIFFGGIFLFIAVAVYFDLWRVCPKCKKRKGRVTKRVTLSHATYDSEGEEKLHCTCKNCGNVFTLTQSIPKLSRSSSSGSSRSYGGGGGGGGSWGGGSTSGGGAGGKW